MYLRRICGSVLTLAAVFLYSISRCYIRKRIIVGSDLIFMECIMLQRADCYQRSYFRFNFYEWPRESYGYYRTNAPDSFYILMLSKQRRCSLLCTRGQNVTIMSIGVTKRVL